ncbi:nectin-2-like isoform X1 [Simochromis diagramma]|uniref:nectin-2-like isoform X1 n=1 Tax=Simochromis diagramma TaxID=43689 RepID=UPI001A7E80BA|nr:nectin-2-like isoform X1 [Simochromis diagramma]
MARHDSRIWPECTKMIGLLCLVSSILLQHGASGQRVKVDQEVTSYPGQTVNLRCAFADPTGVQLSMVTWMYVPEPTQDPVNIAVFLPGNEPSYPNSPVKGRVSFVPSPPKVDSPSIQITDVRMTDEGKYACEFATYPGGNVRGTTQLVMLAKPENSASPLTVVAGTKPITVASCKSANGQPAAEISWVTTANGNYTTKQQPGSDNTLTVISEYIMVPMPNDNGKEITCVVSHRTLVKPESFRMNLAVQFAPQVTIEGYDNNWYIGRTNVALTCNANANPPPTTIQWKSTTGEFPPGVQVSENVLKVQNVDESVNTTFVCEVNNQIGTTKEQFGILVREPPKNPSNAGVVAGAVIGSLLALLLVAALIAVLVTRRRRQQQGYRANGGSDMKTRIFGGGKKASKNGTNGGAGNGGGNNNGPIYVYSESSPIQALGEKNNHQLITMGGHPEVVSTTPTAQDILLSNELDDAEKRKFDELDEAENYDHYNPGGPIHLPRSIRDQEMIGEYDDDMESQRDGSVISRTAVYV